MPQSIQLNASRRGLRIDDYAPPCIISNVLSSCSIILPVINELSDPASVPSKVSGTQIKFHVFS
jgi:hypothetical protein